MAIRVGLADVSNNYALTTTEANTIFTDLVLKEDTMFTMKVTKPEVPGTQTCELYINVSGRLINIKNKVLDKVKIMKPVEYKRHKITK